VVQYSDDPATQDHNARVERLYALAEALGRLTGQARNLADDLTAKIANRRAGTRSTSPARTPTRSRHPRK
jgi:hypothetical protein